MLFATTAASAAKCKFQTDTVNVFTGEKIRWTKWDTFTLRIDKDHYVLLSGISEGDRRYLGLRPHVSKLQMERPTKADLDNALVIPVGGKLSIVLSDDSALELHSDQGLIGDSDFEILKSGEYSLNTDAIIKYSLNNYTMKTLAAQRIKRLRLETVDGNIDFEFSGKGSSKHKEKLACVQ
jgi:hypothetical protein